MISQNAGLESSDVFGESDAANPPLPVLSPSPLCSAEETSSGDEVGEIFTIYTEAVDCTILFPVSLVFTST